jgi:Uma2 family endonuclease
MISLTSGILISEVSNQYSIRRLRTHFDKGATMSTYTQITRRLFKVEEYHQMIRSGILSEDDRVELVKGEIIEMSPVGSRHAACVRRLNWLFSRNLGDQAIILVQDPIRLNEYSEPQPDLALVQPRPDFYEQAHPEPEDILLLVEVAETSLWHDREVKLLLYAQAGIPEVWLVDLAGKVIEVYQRPSPTGYQSTQKAPAGASLTPRNFPSLHLNATTILGD